MRLTLMLSLVAAVAAAPLTLEKRIALPGVNGRIDHLAVDREGGRLFVAALGNNTVEVISLQDAKRVRTLTGFRKPQGLLYVSGRLFVASGDDGSVRTLDGKSLAVLKQTTGLDDADNLRWDAARKQVLVGYGEGALGVLDFDGQKVGDAPLAAHPESFQFDANSGRVFVNVPDKQRVSVVDPGKRKVTADWPLTVGANYPMSLDAAHHRLFVGARKPAKLVVVDTETGRTVAALDIAGDTDDLFYDAAHARVYVIGGAGEITVLHQDDANRYRVEGSVTTAPGARTGLFVPELGRLFVAVPHRGAQVCEILVYRTD